MSQLRRRIDQLRAVATGEGDTVEANRAFLLALADELDALIASVAVIVPVAVALADELDALLEKAVRLKRTE
jgi:hypothetical protein